MSDEGGYIDAHGEYRRPMTGAEFVEWLKMDTAKKPTKVTKPKGKTSKPNNARKPNPKPWKKKRSKKTKEKSIRSYFIPETNFQGFEKRLCVYESSIKDFVFVPKKYAVKSKKRGILGKFCQSCKLGPCIATEHYDELSAKAAKVAVSDGKSTRIVVKRCETLMKGFMRKYFGREYLNRVGLPECVHQNIHMVARYVIDDSSGSDSESSSGHDDGEDEEDSEEENEF